MNGGPAAVGSGAVEWNPSARAEIRHHGDSGSNEKSLLIVVVYDNMLGMILIRQISWVKAAARDFSDFPVEVQTDAAQALSIAARGGKADTAKPFKGFDGGIFEIALRHRGDAYRVIYAVQIGAAMWVVHAFKKKSKTGIETPRMEVDLIRERLKRPKEALK